MPASEVGVRPLDRNTDIVAQTADNPYRLLKVSRTASPEEIEAAYDRIFSQYEPRAQEGDEAAIAMLERLNTAYDTLTNPQPPTRTQSAIRIPQSAIKRPRPRAVQPLAPPSRAPYIIIGLIAIATLAAVIIILLTRNNTAETVPGTVGAPGSDAFLNSPLLTGDEARRGPVVATVNGRPIYQQDYDERTAVDREIALSDPLLGVFLNNFEGITGTRALDILKQDALDRLINVEVIQQQAVKEGVFPNTAQQRDIIAEAKKRDLKEGETFEAFLSSRGITEQQYNRRIIRNLTHTIMAERNMTTGSTSDERIENFSKWVCDTRNKVDPNTNKPIYDIKINLTFTVENPPCTSGLPLPDIALPGVTPEAPEPISTPAAPQ